MSSLRYIRWGGYYAATAPFINQVNFTIERSLLGSVANFEYPLSFYSKELFLIFPPFLKLPDFMVELIKGEREKKSVKSSSSAFSVLNIDAIDLTKCFLCERKLFSWNWFDEWFFNFENKLFSRYLSPRLHVKHCIHDGKNVEFTAMQFFSSIQFKAKLFSENVHLT